MTLSRNLFVLGISAWILFVILVLAAGWTALGACGITIWGWKGLQFCEPINHVVLDQTQASLTEERLRSQLLGQRLLELQRGIAAVPSCPAPSQPDPIQQRTEVAPPPLEPEQPSEPEGEQVSQLERPQNCPVEVPSEVLLVVDTSGSMDYKQNADARAEREMLQVQKKLRDMSANNPIGLFLAMAQIGQLQNRFDTLERVLKTGPGPTRMTVAKEAASAIVDALPPVVDTTLVTFEGCGRYRHAGPFSSAQRDAAKQRIAGLRADEGTPLGRTLRSLPQLTSNGRSGDKPVNIVLISDGLDSCGDDPCAAARSLKRELPFAVVSVVAASRNINDLKCIANLTSGLFLDAETPEDIRNAVRQASGRDIPEQCRQ